MPHSSAIVRTPAFDGEIDDPPLQFERRKLEQEYTDRERRQKICARPLILQTYP